LEEIVERSLVLLKPAAIQRGLIGEIIRRLEQRGLKIIAAKFMPVSVDLAETHYAVHKGKVFYPALIEHLTSAPVMAMVWEGPNAIQAIRQTMGATRPTEAAPGTVRQDLSLESQRNLTHASDSVESAEAEINLWFKKEDIVAWNRDLDRWVFFEPNA
jgi:nucleoside-diphosphate kinase